MKIRQGAILCGVALLLVGCGGKRGAGSMLSILGVVKPYREVRVRLTLDDRPIEAAHVRAVAIETGSMALPVSGEVVEEALYAWGDTAATDETGTALLKLYAHTPHLIEVAPPPFGELAERGPWSWTIEEDGDSLTASTEKAPEDERIRLVVLDK
ncbi:MAG: hypothetical protein JNK58_13225 [Phycisphaerae bacterium]|nr:hypothetical protein [Phycisphaerae bacterium]